MIRSLQRLRKASLCLPEYLCACTALQGLLNPFAHAEFSTSADFHRLRFSACTFVQYFWVVTRESATGQFIDVCTGRAPPVIRGRGGDLLVTCYSRGRLTRFRAVCHPTTPWIVDLQTQHQFFPDDNHPAIYLHNTTLRVYQLPAMLSRDDANRIHVKDATNAFRMHDSARSSAEYNLSVDFSRVHREQRRGT